MEPVVEALREQIDELDGLVSGLSDESWARPSPCPGWSVSDVLVHLAQTNEIATASAEGRWDEVTELWADDEARLAGSTIDDLAGAAVAADRRRSGAEVREWWKRTADDMVGAFAVKDPRARVQWVVGDMAARSLCTTRLSETWVHSTDVAQGLGVELAPTDRLWHIARLVHRTLPYAFQRDGRRPPGAVRFELATPDDPTDTWVFGPEDAPTVVTGTAHDLCRVAGQRAGASGTALRATGPDADGVLALMRTFA
jgi:uncharacterized protein (TIGR03084 family)